MNISLRFKAMGLSEALLSLGNYIKPIVKGVLNK
jgi:hypothetical protein